MIKLEYVDNIWKYLLYLDISQKPSPLYLHNIVLKTIQKQTNKQTKQKSASQKEKNNSDMKWKTKKLVRLLFLTTSGQTRQRKASLSYCGNKVALSATTKIFKSTI